MLQRVQAVADYVSSAVRLNGSSPETDQLKTDQLEHIRSLLNGSPLAMSDAAELSQALADDMHPIAAAFSARDRGTIVAAIRIQPAGTLTATPRAALKAPSQTHYYFHVCLTAADWRVLTGTSNSLAKVSMIVDRAIRIGLTHPSELTIVALIAVITATSRVPLSAAACYHMNQEYKRVNKIRRTNRPQTLLTFPSDVTEFMAKYPAAYAPDDQPHECPVTEDEILRERSQLAARRSHHTLSVNAHGDISLAACGSSSANVMQQLATAIMTQMHRVPQPIPIAVATPRPRPVLALENGSLHDDGSQSERTVGTPDTPKTPNPTRDPDPFESNLADVAKALNAKADAARRPRPMKRPAACGTGDDDELPPPPVKRGEQPMKRHALASGPKPAVTHVPTRKCYVARTGRSGAGSTKSIGYRDEGDADEKAAAEAECNRWLADRCKEIGVKFPMA